MEKCQSIHGVDCKDDINGRDGKNDWDGRNGRNCEVNDDKNNLWCIIEKFQTAFL